MKKVISILLMFVMALSLCACGEKTVEPTQAQQTTELTPLQQAAVEMLDDNYASSIRGLGDYDYAGKVKWLGDNPIYIATITDLTNVVDGLDSAFFTELAPIIEADLNKVGLELVIYVVSADGSDNFILCNESRINKSRITRDFLE